jgi:two-component system, NarL family, nitrate/nitrite response regulator NarL
VSDRIRIAVVDDHPLLRDGVVGTLSREPTLEVIGVGASATDAIALARDQHPDVILLDISMPGGGIEAARQICSAYPAIKTIMLTVSEREEDVTAAMEAGAHGYVLKGITGADLIGTIRAVSRGETYITPQFAARLLASLKLRAADAKVPQRIETALTAREEQILNEVSAGLTNKEVARKLTLSEKTVKHYMTNVLQKLHARNRVEAVLAHQKGLRGGPRL